MTVYVIAISRELIGILSLPKWNRSQPCYDVDLLEEYKKLKKVWSDIQMGLWMFTSIYSRPEWLLSNVDQRQCCLLFSYPKGCFVLYTWSCTWMTTECAHHNNLYNNLNYVKAKVIRYPFWKPKLLILLKLYDYSHDFLCKLILHVRTLLTFLHPCLDIHVCININRL